MPNTTAFADATDGWQPLARLLVDDGSTATAAWTRLTTPRVPLADQADALHCLCLLYGHRPGMIDLALTRAVSPAARVWLGAAADAFCGEREWLSRLVSAAGPVPSTPNQTASENAVATQRHALEMLAQSDRPGCALGAAGALVMDWRAIRALLDHVGERLSLTPPPLRLPTLIASRALLDVTPVTPDQSRALHFGAQQLLAQQRGLWGLIDARWTARTRS